MISQDICITTQVYTSNFNDVPHGIYRAFWKGGGSSLCAIGSVAFGDRWIAPVNWINDKKNKITEVSDIKKLILIIED